MTDISTKSFVQSQLGAKSGLPGEPGQKPVGFENTPSTQGETLADDREKTRQEIGQSHGFGADLKRGKDQQQDAEKQRYTIMVSDGKGEQRALSVIAASAEEAKAAADASLEDGEQVTSVHESTVPEPPDPSRGLVA